MLRKKQPGYVEFGNRHCDNSFTSREVSYEFLLRNLSDGGYSNVTYDMDNQSDRPGYGYQLKRVLPALPKSGMQTPNGSCDHMLNMCDSTTSLLKSFLRRMTAPWNSKRVNTQVSVKAVRNKIKPDAGSTFFVQADAYLLKLQNGGKYNQYTPDKARITNFKKFLGHDIAFQDITPTMLERFKDYVRSKLQNSERTAVNHLVTIRSVFSHAIKDNIIDPKHYPFGKGKVKIKFPDSNKIGLSLEEVKALEDVELPDLAHNHARNL